MQQVSCHLGYPDETCINNKCHVNCSAVVINIAACYKVDYNISTVNDMYCRFWQLIKATCRTTHITNISIEAILL